MARVDMKVPDDYRNRKQTFVKHQLLKAYLERLFMIIGQYQRVIRYVDCFSGPWKDQDEKLQDTSIGISMAIMRKCMDGLKRMKKSVRFQALFIEKDKHSFERLKSHLDEMSSHDVSAEALNGDFYNLREELLNWCGQEDFTFFFIDPKGWKNVVEIPTLEPLLKRPNSEFMINFMYDFLLRTHNQKLFQEDMRAIFGQIPDTSSMDPEQKENYLINLYRKQLKEILPSRGGIPRTICVPILYPLKDRTLYHLVYLTRHAKGVCVFMEESEKLELVQKMVREQAKQESREDRSAQLELFKSADSVQAGKCLSLKEIRLYWISKLSSNYQLFGIEKLADMIEETGWYESDFQAAFGSLSKEGVVANLDDKHGRRKTKFVHFDENHGQGELLIRLK